jgi:hypothetical protein
VVRPPDRINVRQLNLGEIAQVALVVHDLQQTMETYWKVLGIGPCHIGDPATSDTLC